MIKKREEQNEILINFSPLRVRPNWWEKDALQFLQIHSPWQNEEGIWNSDDLYKQWSWEGNGGVWLAICTISSLQIAVFECEEECGVLVDLFVAVARYELLSQSYLVVFHRLFLIQVEPGLVIVTFCRRRALRDESFAILNIEFYVQTDTCQVVLSFKCKKFHVDSRQVKLFTLESSSSFDTTDGPSGSITTCFDSPLLTPLLILWSLATNCQTEESKEDFLSGMSIILVDFLASWKRGKWQLLYHSFPLLQLQSS